MAVCRGVLAEMCLGASWLKVVVASMVGTDASFGIIEFKIPRLSDALYESRFCVNVESWKT